jgi:hypothetical protein
VRVEGNGDECFRDCKNDTLDFELAASLENVLCAHGVGAGPSRAVALAGRRAGRQVDDGVDAAGRHVLSCVIQCGPDDAVRLTYSCQERLQHSSHVETSVQGQSRSVRVLSQRAIWRHPPPSPAPNKQLPQAINRPFVASRVHRLDMASGACSHQDC